MPATYDSIATQTLGSSATIITFSSIPQTYTDLVLVLVGQTTGGADSIGVRLNNDSSAIYMYRVGAGTGSVTAANAGNNETSLRVGPLYGTQSLVTANIMGYTATNMWKTCVSRASNGDNQVGMTASCWRSTAAVTSLTVNALFGSMASGTMATLYGIARA
jgi:hypothetical protein